MQCVCWGILETQWSAAHREQARFSSILNVCSATSDPDSADLPALLIKTTFDYVYSYK